MQSIIETKHEHKYYEILCDQYYKIIKRDIFNMRRGTDNFGLVTKNEVTFEMNF